MTRLADGITYRQIKEVTDWQLSEEAQRQALAQIVNAISQLDVTQKSNRISHRQHKTNLLTLALQTNEPQHIHHLAVTTPRERS